MKFIMTVGKLNGTGEPWEENENHPNIKTETQARQWATDCIQRFNDTLRPKEEPRKLLAVSFPESQTASEIHIWHKTNLVTQIIRGAVFDTMMCSECGVKAKRYGVGNIVIDSEYKAKGFQSCRQAKILLAKRQEKSTKI